MMLQVVESGKRSIADLPEILLTIFQSLRVSCFCKQSHHIAVDADRALQKCDRRYCRKRSLVCDVALLHLTLYSNTFYVSISAVTEAGRSYLRQRSIGWNKRRFFFSIID